MTSMTDLESLVFGAGDDVVDEWASKSVKRSAGDTSTDDDDSDAPMEVTSKADEIRVDVRPTKSGRKKRTKEVKTEAKTTAVWHDADDAAGATERAKEYARAQRQQHNWATNAKVQRERLAKKMNARLAGVLDVGSDDSDEGDDGVSTAIDRLMRTTGAFVRGVQRGQPIPGGQNISHDRQRDITWGYRTHQAVTSVQFHPHTPLLLVAGLSRKLHIFKLNAEDATDTLLQSVAFDKFAVTQAQALLSSNNRPHLFEYDLQSNTTHMINVNTKGMCQTRFTHFDVNSSEDTVVLWGKTNHGLLFLLDARSFEWQTSMKVNGEVVAARFSKRTSYILYVVTEYGELSVWDIRTRECLSKTQDEGCVRASSFALAPNDRYMAIGSNTGIVNVYDGQSPVDDPSSPSSPLFSMANLHTAVTHCRFSTVGPAHLMAFASRDADKSAIRLCNTNTRSVYANYPGLASASTGNVECVDFSPHGAYMAVGQTTGRVGILRLNHYDMY